MDHFLKWLCPFPIKEKTAKECLFYFKIFINAFGIPKKLHTDNGLEFTNNLFSFCNDNNIILSNF